MSRDYGKCCVWTTPILDCFPAAVRKRIYTPLSFSNCLHSQLQAFTAPELAQQGQSQRIQISSHSPTFSVYRSRILLCVCHSLLGISDSFNICNQDTSEPYHFLDYIYRAATLTIQGQVMESVNKSMRG